MREGCGESGHDWGLLQSGASGPAHLPVAPAAPHGLLGRCGHPPDSGQCAGFPAPPLPSLSTACSPSAPLIIASAGQEAHTCGGSVCT